MIGLAADLFINIPNVRLTCAEAGAGLFARSPAVDALIVVDVGGSGVAVDGLVLDATGTTEPFPFALLGGPYLAGDFSGPGVAVPNVRFANNTVTCGPGFCAAFRGTPGAMVLNNTFTHSAESLTGIHIQPGLEDLQNIRVQGNTLVATAPTTFKNFGGIRVFGGHGVIIADNIVTGSWFNSISVTSLTQSQITGNRLTGAVADGIRLRSAQHNLFAHNRATAAGEAGIFADQSCYNLFVGNNLQGNIGNVGAIFAETTGAKTLVGNGTIVIDDGAFDCDGDGVNDPNMITGTMAVVHGVTRGKAVSDAVLPRTTNHVLLK